MEELTASPDAPEPKPKRVRREFVFPVIRLTADEQRIILEKAARAGLKPTEYMRRSGLGQELRARLSDEERRQIAATSNNLNQLTRLANAGKLSTTSAHVLNLLIEALLEKMR